MGDPYNRPQLVWDWRVVVVVVSSISDFPLHVISNKRFFQLVEMFTNYRYILGCVCPYHGILKMEIPTLLNDL